MTVLAIPSKGRLHEQTIAFFREIGIQIGSVTKSREYVASTRALPGLEIRFLSSAEIPHEVAQGNAHLAIVGEDLARETIAEIDASFGFLAPLGFGHADLVIAVPNSWIDVQSLADLDDVAADIREYQRRRLRIATKYTRLCQTFLFANHITDFRLVESVGATEGAPAAGLADCIADITTTGATLAANHLKILDDGIILRSQANLVMSRTAPWAADDRRVAETLLYRVAARQRGQTKALVTASFTDASKDFTDVLTAHDGTVRSKTASDGSVSLTVECPKDNVLPLSYALQNDGAETIAIEEPKYVIAGKNDLIEKLGSYLDSPP